MTGDELRSEIREWRRDLSDELCETLSGLFATMEQAAAELDRLRERQVPAGTYELRWEQTGVYQHDPSDPYSWWHGEQGGECASFEEALAAAKAAAKEGEADA